MAFYHRTAKHVKVNECYRLRVPGASGRRQLSAGSESEPGSYGPIAPLISSVISSVRLQQ